MTRTSGAKSSDLRHNTWLRCSTSAPTSAPGNLAATNSLHIHARRRQMKPQKPRCLFQRREPLGGRAAGILAVSREYVRTFCGASSRQTHLGTARLEGIVGVFRPRPHYDDNRQWKTQKQTAVRLHHSSAHNCFNEVALLTGSLLLLFSSFSKKHNNTHGSLISKTKKTKHNQNCTIPTDGKICMSNCSQDGHVNRC